MKDKQNKKNTCLLPIIILIIIILIIAFVPITEKKQVEYLDYRCEISILGYGNYTLIIPAPIDINGNTKDNIKGPEITNGEITISTIKTKYGSGFIINGTSNSSFKIWQEKSNKNVEWDEDYKIDLDMFKDKPKNKFDDDLRNDSGKIWIDCYYSTNITDISIKLNMEYWKEYYYSKSLLGDILKGNPPNDKGKGYKYDMEEYLISGWYSYNVTSARFVFL